MTGQRSRVEGDSERASQARSVEERNERGAEHRVLRIVRGNPTPEELAAVTVLLTGLARAGTGAQPAPPGGWSDLSLRLRRTPLPGPGAWRNSAWS